MKLNAWTSLHQRLMQSQGSISCLERHFISSYMYTKYKDLIMLKMWTSFNQHQTFGTHTHTQEPTNIMKPYQVKAARELAQEQTRNGIQNVCGRVASKYLLLLSP
jgi:Tfp pilus assembly protein PilE